MLVLFSPWKTKQTYEELESWMTINEKSPFGKHFSCSICGKAFTKSSHFKFMKEYTLEKNHSAALSVTTNA